MEYQQVTITDMECPGCKREYSISFMAGSMKEIRILLFGETINGVRIPGLSQTNFCSNCSGDVRLPDHCWAIGCEDVTHYHPKEHRPSERKNLSPVDKTSGWNKMLNLVQVKDFSNDYMIPIKRDTDSLEAEMMAIAANREVMPYGIPYTRKSKKSKRYDED